MYEGFCFLVCVVPIDHAPLRGLWTPFERPAFGGNESTTFCLIGLQIEMEPLLSVTVMVRSGNRK